MPGTRRFRTWNILDCALTRTARGHHYWETKALIEELVRRGETVRVLSHVNAPTAEQFPGASILPVASISTFWDISNDPTWSRLENFIIHNRILAQDLSQLDRSLFDNSLVLCPQVIDNQLLGIIRWLGTFPEASLPNAALCLVAPKEMSKTDHTAALYKTVWRDCPPHLKKSIALFGRTPQLTDLFAKYADMPARIYPHPIPESLVAAGEESPRPSGGAMVVSFVGGTRRERGGAFIADVVGQCAESGVRFFIQANEGDDDNIDLKALSALPHVRVHEGALAREDYYRAIAESVVLLPYWPDRYRWRDSGVFHEAKLLGAPVLVTAGTSMADEVRSLGNGLVIEELSVPSIADCIKRAQRELPALRAAAERVAQEARRTHGVARCIDAIAGAFGAGSR